MEAIFGFSGRFRHHFFKRISSVSRANEFASFQKKQEPILSLQSQEEMRQELQVHR
jgi:hypothetical protein